MRRPLEDIRLFGPIVNFEQRRRSRAQDKFPVDRGGDSGDGHHKTLRAKPSTRPTIPDTGALGIRFYVVDTDTEYMDFIWIVLESAIEAIETIKPSAIEGKKSAEHVGPELLEDGSISIAIREYDGSTSGSGVYRSSLDEIQNLDIVSIVQPLNQGKKLTREELREISEYISSDIQSQVTFKDDRIEGYSVETAFTSIGEYTEQLQSMFDYTEPVNSDEFNGTIYIPDNVGITYGYPLDIGLI
jgi:hypothetical protein